MSFLKLFGKNDEVEAPTVVLQKPNHGRKPTQLKGGQLPAPNTEPTDEGIWYHEMTPEQKKQYGFFKYGKK